MDSVEGNTTLLSVFFMSRFCLAKHGFGLLVKAGQFGLVVQWIE